MIGGSCAYAFATGFYNLGYFTAVVLIPLGSIVVTDFIVSADSFQIVKYYFFGAIKRRWQFNKGDRIKLSGFGSGFGHDGDNPIDDQTGTGLGCLYMILLVFWPDKIKRKEFKIEQTDSCGQPLNKVHIILNSTEFNHLERFVHETPCR